MKWKKAILFLTALSSGIPLRASDQLLNRAISHDQSLLEVSLRFQELRDRQDDSRVFSREEITEAGRTVERVSLLREEHVAAAVVALGESARLEDLSRRNALYRVADGEYRATLAVLEDITKGQGNRVLTFSQHRDLLEKQKQILQDLRVLSDTMNQQGMTRSSVDELARVAHEQRNLSRQTEEQDIRRDMLDIAETLTRVEVGQAIRMAEALVAKLENLVGQFGAAENVLEEIQRQNLQESLAGIQELRQEIQAAQETVSNTEEPGLSETDRQDAVETLDHVRQRLEESGDTSQNQNLESAMMDILNQEDEAADQTLARVEEHLQNALEELDNQMAGEPSGPEEQAEPGEEHPRQAQEQMAMEAGEQSPAEQARGETDPSAPSDPSDSNQPPPPGPPENPQELTEHRVDHGTGNGALNRGAADGDWSHRLPERERNALQAGRRERFTPHFEAEVSQYFLELAK